MVQTFSILVKYDFFSVENAASLEEGALCNGWAVTWPVEPQYLGMRYEHSLGCILVLFRRAFKCLSWTVDETRERKSRRGLGRKFLCGGQALICYSVYQGK